jgi:ABC-type polysaccharide/polyol phosphate export permease
VRRYSRPVAARLLDDRDLPTELLWNLTLRELRGKFKRSALGWLWSVINPLASIAIYSVVFGVFFDVDTPVGDPSGLHAYGFFLVCGLLPWTYVTSALTGTTQSITMNESLIKKVYFPRWVLPGASTLSWLASFGVELVVLSVVLVIAGNMVIPWIPVVVALIALQTAFIFGIGLVLAAFNAYFRDVQHFLAIALNIWFYATPILYPPELLDGQPAWVRTIILDINPMSVFVDSYRDVLYDLRFPTILQWLAMAAVAVVSLAIGMVVFHRLEPRLAEEL